MSDLASPNSEPGRCSKCSGSGRYVWGAIINGKPSHSGQCHSCGGKGHQTRRDIARNASYNRHKIAALVRA